MLSTEERSQELRNRFGVTHGQFFEPYRYKNMNWYLGTEEIPGPNDEWFCFGDIRDEDISRLQACLVLGEVLVLGWKDLQPNIKEDPILKMVVEFGLFLISKRFYLTKEDINALND